MIRIFALLLLTLFDAAPQIIVHDRGDAGEVRYLLSRNGATVSKWNGEAWLSVENLSDWPLRMYEVPDSDLVPDGGVEVEWIVATKPQSNVFELSLEDSGNLEYFYQPALNAPGWEQDSRNASCTETECEYAGGPGKHRPLNVVGSYAVYHKTKRDHIRGELNYMAGKFGHIYRPKAIDAAGHECWGGLTIGNGRVTVTIDQACLDTATYPVIVDPTFGTTSPGGTNDDPADNWAWSKATSNPAAGTLDSITLYGQIKTASPDPELDPALYSDSSGPSARLAKVDSGGTTFGVSFANVTTNVPGSVSVSSTTYWLGHMNALSTGSSSTNYNWKYDTTGGAHELYYKTSLSGGVMQAWPATASGFAGDADERVTVFGNYTATGGAARTCRGLLLGVGC